MSIIILNIYIIYHHPSPTILNAAFMNICIFTPLSLSQENRTRACNNNNKNDEYLNEIKSSTREREREGKKRNNVNIEIEIHTVLSVMVTLMLKKRIES